MDPIEVFPQVEKMLYNLAWMFAKQHGEPFEDMRSIAYDGFMNACKSYSEGGGMKFASWCYLRTWGSLKTHTMSKAKDHRRIVFAGNDDESNDLLDIMRRHEDDTIPDERSHQIAQAVETTRLMRKSWAALFQQSPREMASLVFELPSVAQEIVMLFMESPKEIVNAATKTKQVEQIKEHLSKRYGTDAVEDAYNQLKCCLVAQYCQ
ncbi:MAG: hypothetical protein KGL39_45060 [Patescibacteria group bacterium]|nr:hypothetical protein [Patescibacteria group bacterium]